MQELSEGRIQSEFKSWLWNHIPTLRGGLAYHIPNGGLRSAREAKALEAMGVEPGMPDYHISVANGVYNSLYIEFKEPDYKMTAHVRNQLKVHENLRNEGHYVVICTSFESACNHLINYLKGTRHVVVDPMTFYKNKDK